MVFLVCLSVVVVCVVYSNGLCGVLGVIEWSGWHLVCLGGLGSVYCVFEWSG